MFTSIMIGSSVASAMGMFVSFFCFLVVSGNFVSSVPMQQKSNRIEINVDLLQASDQDLLGKLSDYELVKPEDTTPFNRNEMFAEIYQPHEKVEKSIRFLYQGGEIILDFVPNRSLLPPTYRERYYLPNGEPVVRKRTDNCYYHGHVRGHEGRSNLAISNYDGYHGYFKFKASIFYIQPLFTKAKERIAHIVYNTKDKKSEPFRCGHNGSHIEAVDNVLQSFSLHGHHRAKRSSGTVLTDIKYVQLYIVNDKSQYTHLGSDIDATKQRAIAIANVADSLYRSQRIRIVLALVETWSSSDMISIVTDSAVTLANFLVYRNDVLNVRDSGFDNAMMISQIQYDQNVAGLAYLKTICNSKSVGIISDKNDENAATTGSILTHEMGHNFGLNHDDECACSARPNAGCIMNAIQSQTPPDIFSSCSLSSLETLLLENVGVCLFNVPTQFVSSPSCGNGFVESGEECDCGTEAECTSQNNTCCNIATCMLNSGSQCSDGPCCNNCQYSAQGTQCRAAANDCDVPEYCNGTYEQCPDDILVLNGIACSSNTGYCSSGQCNTHLSECESLWNGGPTIEDACFDANAQGQNFGYCTKTGDSTYVACTAENVKCGKLQCSGASLTPKPSSYSTTSVEATVGETKYMCWQITAPDEGGSELGLVVDGTRCDNGKVCKNAACVSLATAYPGQPTCTNEATCNGNGVCNQNGNCHCNSGFRCPDCAQSYSGPGGSIDTDPNGCDVDECAGSNACVANTDCTNTVGNYTCSCKTGFTGEGRTSCTDIDECSSSNADCDSNAQCANTDGSYTCTCNSGYTGSGKSCTDIDECTGSNACVANTNCTNTAGNYTCACKTGYTGEGRTSCENINECATPGTCHAQATCNDNNGSYVCNCNSGFSGDGKTSCSDINECDGSNNCDINADCTNNEGSYTCACRTGYSGTDGTSCSDIDDCLSNNCASDASCTDGINMFTCTCNSGYTGNGTSCEDIDECQISSSCQSVANCTNLPGTFNCTCNTGYRWDAVQTLCVDINECTESTHDCHSNAACTNTEGSFTCACNPGYSGDGKGTCSDIDECSGSNNCDSNAVCGNTVGSYTCTCNDGFTGSGQTCTDIDECAGSNACVANTDCTNTAGNYTCACKTGYTGEGRTSCTDIDECSPSNADCDSNAQCANTDGSYTCTCNSGYTGSGKSCEDVNECTEVNNCDSNAACTNLIGTYECTCNSGFTGTGQSCTDIDECAGSNACVANTDCTNTAGSYTCACITGYTGEGKTSCTEINECTAGTHNCDSNAQCTNTDGSFTCACNSGFTGSGQSCTDINECAGSNACVANTDCTNTAGSYTCACKTGYTGEGRTSCTDIDECSANPGPCHVSATCTNTAGSYSCACNGDLVGDGKTSCSAKCSSNPCDPNAVCTDTLTSFTCACRNGWTGSGISCSDIDECQNSVCSSGTVCINTAGSHICQTDQTSTVPVTVTFQDLTYNSNLADENSAEYQAMAARIIASVYEALGSDPTYKGITDITFSQGSLIVNFTLVTNETNATPLITLQAIVQSGSLGDFGNATFQSSANVASCASCHSDADCLDVNSTLNYQCVCKSGFTGDGQTCSAPVGTLSKESVDEVKHMVIVILAFSAVFIAAAIILIVFALSLGILSFKSGHMVSHPPQIYQIPHEAPRKATRVAHARRGHRRGHRRSRSRSPTKRRMRTEQPAYVIRSGASFNDGIPDFRGAARYNDHIVMRQYQRQPR